MHTEIKKSLMCKRHSNPKSVPINRVKKRREALRAVFPRKFPIVPKELNVQRHWKDTWMIDRYYYPLLKLSQRF